MHHYAAPNNVRGYTLTNGNSPSVLNVVTPNEKLLNRKSYPSYNISFHKTRNKCGLLNREYVVLQKFNGFVQGIRKLLTIDSTDASIRPKSQRRKKTILSCQNAVSLEQLFQCIFSGHRIVVHQPYILISLFYRMLHTKIEATGTACMAMKVHMIYAFL